jgi:hypothetical protein
LITYLIFCGIRTPPPRSASVREEIDLLQMSVNPDQAHDVLAR